MRRLLLITLLSMLLIVLVPAFAQDDLPNWDELEDGWNQIDTGGETTCSRGDPYAFYVRKTDTPENVMIFFDGGGACWNQITCSVDRPTFTETVDSFEGITNFATGIFDYDNELNPLADYTTIFVPYCTADIHMGDATVDYNDELSVEHRGAVNSQAVLDWVFANIDTPEHLFITGSSAGAYGSIYWTPALAENYPDARITQFGDAGIGVSPDGWPVLEIWNIFENIADYEDLAIDPATFSVSDIYAGAALMFPDIDFAEYTSASDEVQAQFYNFSQLGGPSWQEGMYTILDDLDMLENFDSYVAGGDSHTILPSPLFYLAESNGVSFLEWFTAFLNGEEVDSVRCVDCEVMGGEIPDEATDE